MSDKVKIIRRGELHEKVWATTLKKVAEDLGITSPEVSQLCETLNVPRPPQGHWQRIKLGLPVEIIPLPDAGAGAVQEAAIEPKKPHQSESPTPPEARREESTSEPVVSGPIGQTEIVSPIFKSATTEEKTPVEKPEPVVPERAEFTRQQLYEAIWATPCQKLAASLGISDVALAKNCKRLGIPRPSLGYWARVAVGEKLPKAPLPPAQAGQDRVIEFDVAANLRRRKELSEAVPSQKNLEELAVNLELPHHDTPLHALAEKHQRALAKVKAGDDGILRLNRRDLFQCDISSANAQRFCRALHAMIDELEARGFKFKPDPDDYGNLRIVKGNDWSTIRCLEGVEQIERKPSEADKRKPSWTWTLKETKPNGKLSFEVHAPGLRGRRTWTEADSRPLEEVLGIIVEKVEATFHGFEEQRQREAEIAKRRAEEEKRQAEREKEEQKRRAEEEKRRQERERLKRHESKLSEIAEARRENLLIATRQWIDSESARAFVEVCEARWREASGGALSKEQTEWLEWARAAISGMSPFSKGHPDAASDGRFDFSQIPVGGPYPKTRALEEEEPVEPTTAAPAEVKTVYVERPQPFPYWALHRKH